MQDCMSPLLASHRAEKAKRRGMCSATKSCLIYVDVWYREKTRNVLVPLFSLIWYGSILLPNILYIHFLFQSARNKSWTMYSWYENYQISWNFAIYSNPRKQALGIPLFLLHDALLLCEALQLWHLHISSVLYNLWLFWSSHVY